LSGHLPPKTPPTLTAGPWSLHESPRRAGPVPDLAAVPPRPFSLDGRWFAGFRGDPLGGFQGLRDLGIFSAASGELILGLPRRDGRRAVWCFFAPDGETAAVHWAPEDETASGAPHQVQI